MPRFVIILTVLLAGSGVTVALSENDRGDLMKQVTALLADDSSALSHIGPPKPSTAKVARRKARTPELSRWAHEIRRSHHCSWRELSRDSIIVRAIHLERINPPAAADLLDEADMVAFVSPAVEGMRTVHVFAFDSEREGQGGGLHDYASFNRGAEYLACEMDGAFEIIGPILWHYN